MDVFPINWDSIPDVMNKEQFFRICHISKSTALHLLKSGKVTIACRMFAYYPKKNTPSAFTVSGGELI